MKETNTLFPVFLKLNELSILIVGGGNVALEKLTAILANSPQTRITLIAKEISKEIREMGNDFPNLLLIQKEYDKLFLKSQQLVFSAVNDIHLAKQISTDAKNQGILCNAADKPELCDFYLGSIVQKGNLKIAISTNGKSPTLAKRLKNILLDLIPMEVNESLDRLENIRKSLKVDFTEKIKILNEITEVLDNKSSKRN